VVINVSKIGTLCVSLKNRLFLRFFFQFIALRLAPALAIELGQTVCSSSSHASDTEYIYLFKWTQWLTGSFSLTVITRCVVLPTAAGRLRRSLTGVNPFPQILHLPGLASSGIRSTPWSV